MGKTGRGREGGVTRLALANAVYFKSSWQYLFRKGATMRGPFHVKGHRRVELAARLKAVCGRERGRHGSRGSDGGGGWGADVAGGGIAGGGEG